MMLILILLIIMMLPVMVLVSKPVETLEVRTQRWGMVTRVDWDWRWHCPDCCCCH